MKNKNFRHYKNINTSSYLTYEETEAIRMAKKFALAFAKAKNHEEIKKLQYQCNTDSVLYGYNFDTESIYFHYLDIYYVKIDFQVYTVVLGAFWGVRDIIKGKLTSKEVSLRNTGKTEVELLKQWNTFYTKCKKRWNNQ